MRTFVGALAFHVVHNRALSGLRGTTAHWLQALFGILPGEIVLRRTNRSAEAS